MYHPKIFTFSLLIVPQLDDCLFLHGNSLLQVSKDISQMQIKIKSQR